MLLIMDSYNIQDGQFSNDILQSYSRNGFSTDLTRPEHSHTGIPKLPEGQPIFDLDSRQAFLDIKQSKHGCGDYDL